MALEANMKALVALMTTLVLVVGVPMSASAGAGRCYSLKNADQKNLCLAQETGQGAEHCGKIRNRDIKKFCEATVQYKSRGMCEMIRDAALKAKCKAALK